MSNPQRLAVYRITTTDDARYVLRVEAVSTGWRATLVAGGSVVEGYARATRGCVSSVLSDALVHLEMNERRLVRAVDLLEVA